MCGSFVSLASSVGCMFVAIWQLKQVVTMVSMREFMAENQHFKRNISSALLIPNCPCLWTISMILSVSDSKWEGTVGGGGGG